MTTSSSSSRQADVRLDPALPLVAFCDADGMDGVLEWRVSDWGFVALLAIAMLALALGARSLWQRGWAQTAVAVAIPLPLLIVLEALMIWYAASGGVSAFDRV